jgi:hypothetical protein
LLVNYVHDSVIRAAETLTRADPYDNGMAAIRHFGVANQLRLLEEREKARKEKEAQQLEQYDQAQRPAGRAQMLRDAWDILRRIKAVKTVGEGQDKLHPDDYARLFGSEVPEPESGLLVMEWDAARKWTPEFIRQNVMAEAQEDAINAILCIASAILQQTAPMSSTPKREARELTQRLLAAKGRGLRKRDPRPGTLEAAVAEGVLLGEQAGLNQPAEDDPEGPDETVQDFGEGTSNQGSAPPQSDVPTAEEGTQNLPAIGFLPAAASSASAEPSTSSPPDVPPS